MWTLASARRYWSNVFCIATGIKAVWTLASARRYWSNIFCIATGIKAHFPTLSAILNVCFNFRVENFTLDGPSRTRRNRVFSFTRLLTPVPTRTIHAHTPSTPHAPLPPLPPPPPKHKHKQQPSPSPAQQQQQASVLSSYGDNDKQLRTIEIITCSSRLVQTGKREARKYPSKATRYMYALHLQSEKVNNSTKRAQAPTLSYNYGSKRCHVIQKEIKNLQFCQVSTRRISASVSLFFQCPS